jgi:hypothetical protein
MMARIVLAGVVGGILAFAMGAVNHMVFSLQDRAMSNMADEAIFIDLLKGRHLKPGLYVFPGMPREVAKADQERVYNELNEHYKAGPAGLLLIAPTGEDMMGPKQLGFELATDTLAAFIAAWIVSLMARDVAFIQRWGAVVCMGVFAWLSLTASYGIWYRFPHEFVHDELLCAVIEWGVAGAAIAAVVRRTPQVSTPAI